MNITMKIVDDRLIITHNWLINHMTQCNLELESHMDGSWSMIKSPLDFHIWREINRNVVPYIEEQFDGLCLNHKDSYKQGLCIICWTNDLVSQYHRCVKCNVIPDKLTKQLCWYQKRIVYNAKNNTLRLSPSYCDALRIKVRIKLSDVSYVDDTTLKSACDKIKNIDNLQFTESQKIHHIINARNIISRYDYQGACLMYIDYITSQYNLPTDVRRDIKYALARFMSCTKVEFVHWSLNDIKG
jgi:hypothetical protein